MTQAIARHIEPTLLARRGASLSGLLAAERCERLAGLRGPVVVELDFAADAEGRPVATGFLGAQVTVRCERCLGPMSLELGPRVRWRFIPGGVPASDDGDVDEIECEGSEVDLAALIEDELLLVMPPYPRHAEACPAGGNRAGVEYQAGDPPAGAAPRTQRPFAGLAGLMGRKPGLAGSQEED